MATKPVGVGYVRAVCACSKQVACPLGVTKEMTAGAERVMFSDLRSLQLRKSMEIKVLGLLSMERDQENHWVLLLVCCT